jgi:malonyl-CoA O-methyltransferase
MASDTRRAIDSAALARARQRMARADAAPWLHSEVARRMAERLPLIKLRPTVAIDWWPRLGASRELLRAAYPGTRFVQVQPAEWNTLPSEPWWRALIRRAPVAVSAADVQPAAAQLVWANMVLHAVDDPGTLFARWQHALAVDGLLMFSTLGPGTLSSLRALYADAGWGPAHAPFVDMHDLGDMLVAKGLADPVMDQETLRLTWATPEALLAELRGLGINADPTRHAGLRTPSWRARLAAALAERAAPDGRVAMEFEIVYGHAFKPSPRVRASGETVVSVEALRQMARTPPRGPRQGGRDEVLG